MRTLDALHAVIAFFEERRGRLYGFRFRDRTDWRSGPPSREPTPLDQRIGTGDGASAELPAREDLRLVLRALQRPIAKPVGGTVRVAVNGVEQAVGAQFNCDPATGLVTFAAAPPAGAVITAGFAFDVPVRFDTDELDIDLSAFDAGAHPADPADRDRSLDIAMSSPAAAGREGDPRTRSALWIPFPFASLRPGMTPLSSGAACTVIPDA